MTGLLKRDKERTKKILDKYKTHPNREQTKNKCVIGCEEGTHYWGSLRFCELLLDLDTIAERWRLCAFVPAINKLSAELPLPALGSHPTYQSIIWIQCSVPRLQRLKLLTGWGPSMAKPVTWSTVKWAFFHWNSNMKRYHLSPVLPVFHCPPDW